jgi:lactate dehydrogenase-like 2-hydroxyacid dehydrogenase
MSSKPSILHLGDPCRWHADLYKKLEAHFTIIRPSAEERERPAFLAALKEKRWGNFAAIMRPFWNTGGEMGRIDRELISLLPDSVKVYASAGAGFDWVDTDILAEKGKCLLYIFFAHTSHIDSTQVSSTATVQQHLQTL